MISWSEGPPIRFIPICIIYSTGLIGFPECYVKSETLEAPIIFDATDFAEEQKHDQTKD